MKCANPTCLLDARTMPRIKHGPVADYTHEAMSELEISADEALTDEPARQKVIAVAKQKAYQEFHDLCVCNNCTEWAMTQLPEGATVMFGSMRRRS